MVECRVVGVAAAAEPVEMILHCIGSASAQDLANCTGSGRVEVAEVKTWW